MLLHHLTLTTGHVCALPRPHPGSDDQAAVRRLLDGEAVEGWSLRFLPEAPGVAVFDILYLGRRLAASWLCLDERSSRPLWEMISATPGLVAPGVTCPKQVPWLAAAICFDNPDFLEERGLSGFAMMLHLMPKAGVLERLIAWTLIEGAAEPSGAHTTITIRSSGQELASTTYWDTEHARAGLCHLSGNGGAWRLLVPDSQRGVLAEMATGRFVEAELEVVDGRRCVALWFIDGSPSPFRLLIDLRHVDRAMVPTKTRRPLLIYTRDGLVQRTTIRTVSDRR